MVVDSYLVLASFAALLIGLSKGGLPTIGMLAVPVLSMVISPVKAAVLLLPIYVISDMVSVWLYRRNFSLPNLKVLVPASMVGIFVGWLTAAYTSDSAVIGRFYKFHISRWCAALSGVCPATTTSQSCFCWHCNDFLRHRQFGEGDSLPTAQSLFIGRSDTGRMVDSYGLGGDVCWRLPDQNHS